ncbi:endolytic transglycosylase MltG [Cellulophaga lytica]|uniref:Endolytic murein transglycosylase n=1 Tax=Cellulophaga lytica (strain ATCC 23178 / DSM 7489 / JCM 8516 / NBRC 14961 / NCIMB 1423 / VKM B-1433 / Cy l20) TaxID=867900 RepID=F0REP8_CELLC|nr:endolytic transglycosylase MltG [Cellulophaga lytica]ADY27840.1 aminodeoxychorismate lyase [Cellulophaga lytica DSM 7489]WQG77966.1 endolytic transglycosylase MltG [Cellulophaga lytica]
MYIKRILVAVLLIGLVGCSVFAYMVYGVFFVNNTNFNNDAAYVFVKSTDKFNDVKQQVAPLLKDVEDFEAAAKRKGYISNVKSGKFEIKKGMNNNEIINSLRGRNIPVKVSFNNQETLEDLAGRVATQIEADSLSLIQAFNEPQFLKENNFTHANKLAMYIPNSYEFYWNSSAETFRSKMLTEYKRFWNEDRKAKAKSLGLTENEVVALASIVHKETAKVDERPRVAGVYLNRLRKGMLLQADPTVIYALKLHQNNFKQIIKRVLYKDLKLDSPYNTYMYAGLPPGPIAMPDISAVNAVLNSEKHDYYYFVANVENFGYHKFAKTLSQHNRNKEQYIRWINKQNINR